MSKIYIKIDENEMVNYQHNLPFDSKYGLNKSASELLAEGYLVEGIPEAPVQEGKIGRVKYVNGEFVFEYTDIPPSEQTEIQQIKQQNTELTLATIDLADTVAAQSAQLQEQGEALIDLANTVAEVLV